MTVERCITCGQQVKVISVDEGTSHFIPYAENQLKHSQACEAMLIDALAEIRCEAANVHAISSTDQMKRIWLVAAKALNPRSPKPDLLLQLKRECEDMPRKSREIAMILKEMDE